MWKPLNVEVKLVNTDLKTHYALLRDKGDFDVARAGWIADYSDPQNFLFLARERQQGPELRELCQSRVRRADEEGRRDEGPGRARQGAEARPRRIFVRDQPYLPLLFYGSKNLVSDKVSASRATRSTGTSRAS